MSKRIVIAVSIIFILGIFLLVWIMLDKNYEFFPIVSVEKKNSPEININVKEISTNIGTMSFFQNLSVHETAGKPFGFDRNDNNIWAGNSSGLVHRNISTGSINTYSIHDGVAPGYVHSVIAMKDGIWFTPQGGGIGYFDYKTNAFKQIHYVPAFSNDSWESTFYRQSLPDVALGLFSDSNLFLEKDLFSNDIWSESFVGVSRFDAKQNKWVSYGSANQEEIHSSNQIAFSNDYVVVLSPEINTGKSRIYTYDRLTEKWNILNEMSDYPFLNAESIISGDDRFRVLGEIVVSDKTKTKRVMYSYQKDKGWMSDTIFNQFLSSNKAVSYSNPVQYKNGIISLFIYDESNDNIYKESAVTYDPKLQKIEVKDNAIQNKYLEVDKLEKVLQEKVNRSIYTDVILSNNGRMLVTDDYSSSILKDSLFKTHLVDDKFSFILKWDAEILPDLVKKLDDFNDVYDLWFLNCNDLRNPGHLVFRINIGSIGPGGDGKSRIAVYDKNKSSIEIIGGLDDLISPEDRRKKELQVCPDSYSDGYFIQDEFSYNINIQSFALDKENVKTNFIESILLAKDDNAPADPTRVFDINDNQLLVGSNNGGERKFLFIYNFVKQAWQKVPIVSENIGDVVDAKIFADKIVVITNEGIKNGYVHIVSNDISYKVMDINDIPLINAKKLFVDNDTLIINAEQGAYILRSPNISAKKRN